MSFTDIYTQLEPKLEPILKKAATKIHKLMGIPLEDAHQEARLIAFKSLREYDYSKSHGGLYRYVHTMVNNQMLTLAYRLTTLPRSPHVVVREGGQLKTIRTRGGFLSLEEVFLSLDEAVESECSDRPDRWLEREFWSRRVATLKIQLRNSLDDRGKQVFDLICNPPDAFLVFMKNINAEEPSSVAIGKYLGLTKNAVDWSRFKIRLNFTKLAESEFPDLVERHITGGNWPMFHLSDRRDAPDYDYVGETIRARKLDAKPIEARDIVKSATDAREIQKYDWGAAMVLKRGCEYVTLVIEGRFNPSSGVVQGVDGSCKTISDLLPWYGKFTRGLDDENRR